MLSFTALPRFTALPPAVPTRHSSGRGETAACFLLYPCPAPLNSALGLNTMTYAVLKLAHTSSVPS